MKNLTPRKERADGVVARYEKFGRVAEITLIVGWYKVVVTQGTAPYATALVPTLVMARRCAKIMVLGG